VRYALDGAPAPDGGIAGLSAEAPVNGSTGLADFLFDKPGRYRVVARAKAGPFVTPWSAAVDVNAIAPFDLAKVTFPDARGPRYRLRGVVRERAARGRVTISVARGRKKGRYRRIGTARIGAKGRFTRRFRLKHTGTFRIRYTYKGSDLVAAGRVVDRIRIRR
jgi:hypothetical protein